MSLSGPASWVPGAEDLLVGPGTNISHHSAQVPKAPSHSNVSKHKPKATLTSISKAFLLAEWKKTCGK